MKEAPPNFIVRASIISFLSSPIRTYDCLLQPITVGTGIAPVHVLTHSRTVTAGGDLHPALKIILFYFHDILSHMVTHINSLFTTDHERILT